VYQYFFTQKREFVWKEVPVCQPELAVMLAKLVSPVKYRTGPYLQLAANMVPGQARPQAADLLVSPDLSVLSPLSRQLDRPTLIGSGPISPLTTDC